MEIVITEVLSTHLYYFIPIFITLTDVHLVRHLSVKRK